MKKFLALALALAMTASLAACGGGGGGSSAKQPDNSGSGSGAASNPPAPSGDKVAISVIAAEYGKQTKDWWASFQNEFNRDRKSTRLNSSH